MWQNDIVIVGDLHLAAGYDCHKGLFHLNEDFFYDDEFARFLDNLRSRATAENRAWRLVILGDFLDFPLVDVGQPLPVNTDDALAAICINKLDLIAQGHPKVFEALGRFVAAGFPLDIVPGNHDVDLLRPLVQQRLIELVRRASPHHDVSAAITFHPWIYYLPGVLYAEHGNQYHDIGWFQTLLASPRDLEVTFPKATLAQEAHRSMVGLAIAIDPAANNVKFPGHYLTMTFRKHPLLILKFWRQLLNVAQVIFGRMLEMASGNDIARRLAYREQVLRPYADQIGLRFETVVAIDQLAASTAASIWLRLFNKFVVIPALHRLWSIGKLIIMYVLLRKLTSASRLFCLVMLGVLSCLGKKRNPSLPSQRSSDYLRHIPLAIHRLLEAENKAVPYYVFGHTHIAEHFPLLPRCRLPAYFNCGTWLPHSSSTLNSIDSGRAFTFVQITHDVANSTPNAGLFFWNDATGQPEPPLC